jgi:quercetin dioxygenase-like cupin family protein
MKQLEFATVALLCAACLASLDAHAGSAVAEDQAHLAKPQVIFRAGSQPSFKGGAESFTGDVRVDPMFPAGERASFGGATVTFQPGARSAWHTHPAGQYLIVVSGIGWTQAVGGPVDEIRVGDVVWCPPGVKHWHGASPNAAMSHITLAGTLDGKNVEWMEHVSEKQYRR